MGWRQGMANLMDFIGQYSGNYGLMKQKQKLSSENALQKQMETLTRDPMEYGVWTDPNNPMRKLIEAKYPGLVLPLMEGVKPQDFLKLKRPPMGGVGGGLKLFGTPSDVVNVDE